MRVWELVRYSAQNCLRAPLRTALTIMGIGIASGALVSMVAFVLGLRDQVETPIKKLGLLNNIEVRSRSKGEDLQIPESEEPPVLDDETLAEFDKIDGVDYSYPDFRLSEVQLSRADTKCSTYAIGLPREASLMGYSTDLLIAGKFFSIGDESEVVLGEKMVEHLGFKSASAAVGQKLGVRAAGLMTTENSLFSFETLEITVRVVGIYRPPSFATRIGADAVLLPVDLMRDLPGTLVERGLRQLRSGSDQSISGYSQVIVRVKNPLDASRVGKKIETMGFATESMMDRIKEMRRFFVFMEVLLAAVGTVALIVAGLGILNTLLMTVMERYQEIGIYKAIGASNGDVRIMFLTEAGIVGIFGGLCGLVLARVVCWTLQWAVNTYAATQDIEGPMAAFRFPLWLLCGAVLYSLMVSILSGLYPASRAANVDPLQALRR